jgi:hypothetical protein
MPEHIIIKDEAYFYKCLNCGFKSEPPWMTQPPDIAEDARPFHCGTQGLPSPCFWGQQ